MAGEIILYNSEDGAAVIQLRARDGNVWLTQARMAELFQASKQNISLHIRNILAEGQQDAAAVVKEYLTTAADGKAYGTQHYSLPMILAVGFRVRGPRGAQFRRWASASLSEYLVEELLARIRDIRSSEKLFDLYTRMTASAGMARPGSSGRARAAAQ